MRKLIIAMLLIPCLFAACSKEEEKDDSYESVKSQRLKKMVEHEKQKAEASRKKPLAIVNDKKIYEEDLQDGNLDLTVTNEVLYQVALDRGIDKVVEPEVIDYEKQLVLNIIKSELRNGIEPKVSDSEIQDYYSNNKHEYTLVEVEELISQKRDVAEEIRKEALKGTEFKSILKQMNTSQNVQISYKETSKIVVGVFSEALDLGQISQVIHSDGKYIVQKVINKKAPDFEELKDTLLIYLTKQKVDEQYNSIIDGLKKEKNVKILVQNEGEQSTTK